jgi:ankyrin repeat protein
MTKLLLGLKADVNTVGNVTSPLHIAAEEGHEEITKLLLENGANVNALNDVCFQNRN